MVVFQAEVTLETSHIGKGCDRDTYNLASQRQLCGASDLAIDLLPDPQHVSTRLIPGSEDSFQYPMPTVKVVRIKQLLVRHYLMGLGSN